MNGKIRAGDLFMTRTCPISLLKNPETQAIGLRAWFSAVQGHEVSKKGGGL